MPPPTRPGRRCCPRAPGTSPPSPPRWPRWKTPGSTPASTTASPAPTPPPSARRWPGTSPAPLCSPCASDASTLTNRPAEPASPATSPGGRGAQPEPFQFAPDTKDGIDPAAPVTVPVLAAGGGEAHAGPDVVVDGLRRVFRGDPGSAGGGGAGGGPARPDRCGRTAAAVESVAGRAG